ncbi:MAG: 4Fe-4S dicluster domain-containing protein [Dehalobacterium sp.]
MAKNWYPVIDMEKCISCGTCIDFCKHGVYDKENSVPTIVFPEGCIDKCRGCQNRCPENAISYFGDDGEESTGCSCGCGC